MSDIYTQVYNPQPKPEKYTNKDYLDFIDTLPCLVCGKPSTHCHVRKLYWGAGTGIKSHDYCAIPLCLEDHTYENERKYGTDRQIAELLMKYIDYLQNKK